MQLKPLMNSTDLMRLKPVMNWTEFVGTTKAKRLNCWGLMIAAETVEDNGLLQGVETWYKV